MQRKTPGTYEMLNENQKRLYDITRAMSGGQARKLLKLEDIRNEFRYWHPGEKRPASINMPANFCYDRVNMSDRPNKFMISDRRNGRYRFVGFDWNPDKPIDIHWSIWVWEETFKVGYYKNREFFWDFDIVLQYLREYESYPFLEGER
ncbi:MAG: hypothetical protein ACYDHW_01265 [Syntrophorhabdaceae bacterium]